MSQSNGSLSVCVVCNRSRYFSKYRRHLLTHVKNGEIPIDKVHKLLFKHRTARCDFKKRNSDNPQSGYMCCCRDEFNVECKHIVLNLRRHLISVHKLDKSYILKRNGLFFFFFFFCLSGNYFGTGKGYKLEIWQEGVVSKYKERFFF